ncbi:MAG: DUF2283 domain-containing protein [Candidatus Omnitrophica bacterium]|nr:DUF2283 domain-containing protein [Candidatus Omnitrophota bacterium]MCM8792893.1 DUF2283 domain-containing protein [Candidatus Omnitrophota bacterium]
MDKERLNIYYDKEADVLYISKGKPSSKDESEEIDAGIVVRKNSKTGEIKGLTVVSLTKLKKNILPMKVSFEELRV